MKIALVASEDFFSDYGGGQVYVRNLVNELISQGKNVVVFSLAENKSNIPSVKKSEFVRNYNGVPVYRVLSPGLTKKQLKVLLEEVEPDIVHAHGFKMLFAQTCHEMRIPCVITAHHGGILCPQGALLTHEDEICRLPANVKTCLPCVLRNIRTGITWWPFLKMIPTNLKVAVGKRLSLMPFVPFLTPIGKASYDITRKIKEWQVIRENATLLIAPSHAIASSMIRNGARSSKVTVIPHGIPLLEKTGDEISVREVLRFFFVGRLCREKGVHIMLDAFTHFSKKKLPCKVELHIIGGAVTSNEKRYWGDLKNKFRIAEPGETHKQGPLANIVYHGKLSREDTLRLIAGFDVLVHPAIFLEVFGLDIAEAQMLGKPVISTRCGGAEMQIREGENGWLISPNRVDELVKAMTECVNNRELLEKMIIASGKRVIPLQKHVSDLMNVYRKYAINSR
ncbi:MAG: glycosyltransferase family 4 protein [Bacteroidota bacterium]|nr:glycosyltransferase family 4 protein [Bacteroidota bacterium]